MGRLINIFKGSTGINNKIDPVRLKFDPKTGIQDMASGVNINIDPTGRISRSKGYEIVLEKNAHSIFSCGDYCLFVSGDALCVLESGFSWAAIRNITIDARMNYVLVAGDVYYMNGYEKGIVRDKKSYDWTGSSYVGPTTTKAFSDPPIGHLLEIYNGRMYIAQDKKIWYSDRLSYAWYDLSGGYLEFSDRITMLKAVKDGLFISTEKTTFFESGALPQEFKEIRVADYPATEGTVVEVNASRIGNGEMTGLALMWGSEKGICIGGPGGYFMNITERKLDYPSARYGAGLYRDGKYICVLRP